MAARRRKSRSPDEKKKAVLSARPFYHISIQRNSEYPDLVLQLLDKFRGPFLGISGAENLRLL